MSLSHLKKKMRGNAQLISYGCFGDAIMHLALWCLLLSLPSDICFPQRDPYVLTHQPHWLDYLPLYVPLLYFPISGPSVLFLFHALKPAPPSYSSLSSQQVHATVLGPARDVPRQIWKVDDIVPSVMLREFIHCISIYVHLWFCHGTSHRAYTQ